MATVSVGTTTDRFQFIKAYGKTLGVNYLCEWLGVSRSGFYAWRKRGPSQRAQEDSILIDMIDRIHVDSGGAYGAPRVCIALRREGVRIGEKRTARLMKALGLAGRCSRIYRRKSGTVKFFTKHQNLLLDTPAPTATDRQWVADLSYIKVSTQWFYLAIVLDLFSRRIVGWSLGKQKSAQLTLKALQKAVVNRNPVEGLIFHTDRGSEYGAGLVQHYLLQNRIVHSMNRGGAPADNAYAESFFHTVKAEKLHGLKFNSEKQLRQTLTSYIDEFYNQRRFHSSLDYRSPAEFEKLTA